MELGTDGKDQVNLPSASNIWRIDYAEKKQFPKSWTSVNEIHERFFKVLETDFSPCSVICFCIIFSLMVISNSVIGKHLHLNEYHISFNNH